MSGVRRRPTVAGLVIAFGGPLIGTAIVVIVHLAGGDLSLRSQTLFGVVWQWLTAAALIVIVTRYERRPLASIGFTRARAIDLGLVPAAWLGSIIVSALVVATLRDMIDTSPVEQILELDIAVKLAIVITAAVTEEIMFRGFAFERLEELTRRTWLAATLTVVIFAALHAPYYGLVPAIARLPATIVLTVLYVRRRSLVPVIAVHFLVDLPVVFVSEFTTG